MDIDKKDISPLIDLEIENLQESIQNSKLKVIDPTNNRLRKESEDTIQIKNLYGENCENIKISPEHVNYIENGKLHFLRGENFDKLNFLKKRKKLNINNL